MHSTIRPPPPPPKDIFFTTPKASPVAPATPKTLAKTVAAAPIEPEELTELLDDDLEQWASGGTRILAKGSASQPPPAVAATLHGNDHAPMSFAPTMQSIAPVAYPSFAPPSVRAPQKSSGAVWAVVLGMTAMFGIAAVGGIIFLLRAQFTDSTESTTTTATTSETVQAAPPPVVTTETVTTAAPLATLAAPVQTAQPIQTAHQTQVATPSPIVATPVKPAGNAMLQTFAAGNGKPIFVDGKQVGVGGSHIKTACGKHSISVGGSRARMIDLPCGGQSVTVGSPDGT